ncbi:hypothetical protein LOD99_4996 [Oopsacas minuta]|uniref:Uncharacterized protein n=1 Tax=Oopsacas minuta TaxID=111878 RepID=A0AAV7JRY1_9METZ|nr:hypothetical protein LOD99_4996 [Oopsacas minuta]
MKQIPKVTKRVKPAKPLSVSQEISKRKLTADLAKPELKEIAVQVIEAEFLSEQESSDIFSQLSNNLSRKISKLDNEWKRIGSKEEMTLKLGDPRSFFENYTSMKSTIEELTSMVKIYSLPLNDRKILMDELEDKVKERQALVDQSLQQLQKTTGELQLTHKHQVIENWEKLFCATEAYNTHGRRWKFLMRPLKKSIKDGSFNFNPEVVLEKARSAQGEDIDAIMERVSKQSRRSQVNTYKINTIKMHRVVQSHIDKYSLANNRILFL